MQGLCGGLKKNSPIRRRDCVRVGVAFSEEVLLGALKVWPLRLPLRIQKKDVIISERNLLECTSS